MKTEKSPFNNYSIQPFAYTRQKFSSEKKRKIGSKVGAHLPHCESTNVVSSPAKYFLYTLSATFFATCVGFCVKDYRHNECTFKAIPLFLLAAGAAFLPYYLENHHPKIKRQREIQRLANASFVEIVRYPTNKILKDDLLEMVFGTTDKKRKYIKFLKLVEKYNASARWKEEQTRALSSAYQTHAHPIDEKYYAKTIGREDYQENYKVLTCWFSEQSSIIDNKYQEIIASLENRFKKLKPSF